MTGAPQVTWIQRWTRLQVPFLKTLQDGGKTDKEQVSHQAHHTLCSSVLQKQGEHGWSNWWVGKLCGGWSSEATWKMRSEDETESDGGQGMDPRHSTQQTPDPETRGKCEYKAEDKTHHTQTYGLVEALQDLGPLWDFISQSPNLVPVQPRLRGLSARIKAHFPRLPTL